MSMKFYDDDGNEINADLIPKPDLCITCARDKMPSKEEMLCTMTVLLVKTFWTFVYESSALLVMATKNGHGIHR